MTDFGKRSGDMSKSVYDTDGNDIVDKAESLSPGAVVDATKIMGVSVDDTDKGNAKVLAYNSTSENLEYETPASGGHSFIDRGDPASSDFEVGDLTTDGNWNDLDLSGIITAGALFVYLRALIQSAGTVGGILFRENGNSNNHNALYVKTMAAGQSNSASGFIKLDANRKIEYRAEDVTWSTLRLIVRGWVV